MKRIVSILSVLSLILLLFSGCIVSTEVASFPLDNIPEFDGKSEYVNVNEGKPSFEEKQLVTKSYESYSDLDPLGRCGVAIACIGVDIMPTEDRESISEVKPSGWQSTRYDIVPGTYLYNRCHLIGFQLTGENANKENLITGTRFMNVEGMLPFENMVADYVKETENHVLYRVTPIFEGNNLVASGVLMEAKSVEDDGEGIEFCVYVYNAQPGIVIDYKTGLSCLASENPPHKEPDHNGENLDTDTYILNKSTKKIHKPTCTYAKNMKEENKEVYEGKIIELMESGYTACGTCKP